MEKTIKIGINGFGRIGRNLFRLLINHPRIEVVAVNDIANTKTLAHLLKYDSIHGVLHDKITHSEREITVAGKSVRFSSEKNIDKISWKNVDVVVECSGKFKTRNLLQSHLSNGGKKVILSVPPLDDDIKTVVIGVNEHIIEPEDTIISNASCTTNNAAPHAQGNQRALWN